MSRVLTLIAPIAFCLVCSSFVLAQQPIAPHQAIGDRVELDVRYKKENGEFTCAGLVVQVDEHRIILEDVTKTENVVRGVPFLSNVEHREKLFTNVGSVKTVELEYGIVVPLNRIISCRLETPKSEKTLSAADVNGSGDGRFHGIERVGVDFPIQQGGLASGINKLSFKPIWRWKKKTAVFGWGTRNE